MAGSGVVQFLLLLMPLLRFRPGSSLVELLLFLGFFALTAGVAVALLMSNSEQRLRQQAVAQVDQTGVQLLQTLTRRIRRAERILDPPLGETGAVLALRMAQAGENPTVLYMQTGALMAGIYNDTSPLTDAGQMVAANFVARNTSVSETRQSVLVSFTLSRTISLPQSPTYTREFTTLITLFPDDQEEGSSCGCAVPACVGGTYQWEYCEGETCSAAPVSFSCE
jgi:Tfp pilus assembly protein PilW